jgi:hypothetical protein
MVVRNNIIVILGSAKENVCNHQREYLVDERISETLRKGNAKSFRGNDLHGGLTAMATPGQGISLAGSESGRVCGRILHVRVSLRENWNSIQSRNKVHMSNEWLDLGPRLEAENKTMRDELRSLRKEVSQLKASISHLESEVRSRR